MSAALFHVSGRLHHVGFARINQGWSSSRQNAGRDMQRCREESAPTRAQPTTVVDMSCSTRGSSCAQRIAACTYPNPSLGEHPQPEKLRSKLLSFLLVALISIDADHVAVDSSARFLLAHEVQESLHVCLCVAWLGNIDRLLELLQTLAIGRNLIQTFLQRFLGNLFLQFLQAAGMRKA
eukprot:s3235_g7.t1